AGRFDRQILVDRPDKAGRLQILQVHARKVRLAPAVELEQVAALTPGFSGADLANLVNEAALLATRRGGDAVSLDDFTQAIERLIAGLEKKNRVLNPNERRIVAHLSTGAADDLAKVTDIARSMVMRYGMALGHVAYEEERAPFLGGPLPQGHREFSEETAREIDVAVRGIVERAYEKAVGILR